MAIKNINSFSSVAALLYTGHQYIYLSKRLLKIQIIWSHKSRKATICHKRQLAISDKSPLESKGDNLPQVDRGDRLPQKGGPTICHNY